MKSNIKLIKEKQQLICFRRVKLTVAPRTRYVSLKSPTILEYANKPEFCGTEWDLVILEMEVASPSSSNI